MTQSFPATTDGTTVVLTKKMKDHSESFHNNTTFTERKNLTGRETNVIGR